MEIFPSIGRLSYTPALFHKTELWSRGYAQISPIQIVTNPPARIQNSKAGYWQKYPYTLSVPAAPNASKFYVTAAVFHPLSTFSWTKTSFCIFRKEQYIFTCLPKETNSFILIPENKWRERKLKLFFVLTLYQAKQDCTLC